MYGTTALFFFKLNNTFLTNLSEKFGLAASWIKIFLTFNLLAYVMAIKEESLLSFPPFKTLIFDKYFFLINDFLFVTKIMYLKSLHSKILSNVCSNTGLFL